jgi:hypothetical protein
MTLEPINHVVVLRLLGRRIIPFAIHLLRREPLGFKDGSPALRIREVGSRVRVPVRDHVAELEEHPDGLGKLTDSVKVLAHSNRTQVFNVLQLLAT